MKYLSTTFAIFAILLASCNSEKKADTTIAKEVDSLKIKREQFVKDSIYQVEMLRRDSLEKIKKENIERLKPLFTERKDEFSDRTWFKPKDSPKYTNANGVYCYFSKENGKVENFRFRFQYFDDDWLFIKNMIFNIDGENITIVPDMETDCGDGDIWEWCDELVGTADSYCDVSEDFIIKLSKAKSVKVKLNGRQYYDTRTLSQKQIKSIKNTYDYYKALGGQF